MDKRAELREKALKDLQQSEVLMLDGHFDYGNGYHGRVYLNPHQLFRHPSTIWRFAQDLIDLLPGELVQRTEVVAGPVTGGALLAHTIAGLLDSRRSLTHPPCSLRAVQLRPVRRLRAARVLPRARSRGKRVLLADDVRNTGETFARCAALVQEAGGTVRRDGRDLRPLRSDRRSRRAEHRARRIQSPAELHGRRVPAVQGRHADHALLERFQMYVVSAFRRTVEKSG